MSQDAIKVGIVADDKTAKGIKSAKKNVSSLERSVQHLGKTFVSVFAAQKIISFTKLSAKAAAADQASAAKLANAVKNLGLEFANPYISDYIASMEKQSKIADDELRPAFQTLITQTGNLAKSQELLATAIDVSRGSGESLATVSNDLAQAYVGNVKGLKKYKLGLSSAQLQASSFLDIQKLLNSQFAGASQTYLNTYQGQIDSLSLAFGNLQESAGRAFFTLLGGSGGSASGASWVSRFIEGIGIGLEEGAQKISDFFVRQGMSQNQFDAYIAKRNQAPAPVAGHELFLQSSSNNAAQLKLEKQRQALIKAQLAAQAKITAEQKKQAALKKAGTVFDLDQIQLVAALKGKLSEDEKKRAEAQLALLSGNEKVATQLTNEILASQDATGNLAKLLTSLPNANNPFQYLEGYIDTLKKKINDTFPATGGSIFDSYTPPAGNTQVMPSTNTQDYSGFALPNTIPGSAGSASQFGSSTPWAQAVQVFIDGKEIAAAVQNQALNGNASTINRAQGNFG